MESWKTNKIFSRSDGSFVITYNGMPYHVPNIGEYQELWKQVKEFIEQNPEKVEEEVQVEEDVTSIRVAQIKARLWEIDQESIRPMRAKLTGTAIEEDETRYTALEEEAVALRLELADLENANSI